MLDLVFLAAISLSGSYGLLLIATLLLQSSSNVAHGALQGIIPDFFPEEQRGRASGVKAIMELPADRVGRKPLVAVAGISAAPAPSCSSLPATSRSCMSAG